MEDSVNKLENIENNPTDLVSHQDIIGTFDNNQINVKRVFSRKFLYILIPLLTLSVISVSIVYWNKTSQEISNNKMLKNNIEVTPHPIQFDQQSKTKQWILKKNINGKSQVLLSLCGDCYSSYIEQWKDWLFYPTFEKNTIQIKGYNLKTDEIKTIYDVNENAVDFQGRGKGLPSEVSDIQVINNTLFFSLGGYLAPGGIFWVDLPATVKPQKLTDSSNAKITFWKNRYWIMSDVGDACWGVTDYSLVDLTTKKVSHIASSTSGCFEGEEYIDIDKVSRMILAFHTQDFGSETESDKDGIYQYVIAIPLSNSSIKEVVIAKQEMPADITSIIYLEGSNQLLLVGEEKYLYDFSSKTLLKTDVAVPTPIPLPEVINKTFEDKIKGLNLPPDYTFVQE